MDIACDAIIILGKRYARLAAEMAEKEKDPKRKAELLLINGGSVYGKVQDVPKNSSRESVYPVKVKTNPAVIDKEITCNRQDGSSWTAYTDSNGELMMYLPVSTEYIAFNVDDTS